MSEELDLNTLKGNIRDELRNWIMPKCTYPLEEYSLSNGTVNFEIAQSFIPYSTALGTMNSYSGSISLVLKKYSSPIEGLSIYLESSSNDEPSGSSISVGTVPPASIGASATTYDIGMTIKETLGTRTKYWIRVVPNCTISDTNYYSIYRDTIDTHYWRGTSNTRSVGGTWGTTDKDIYFDFKTPNWIWSNYPHERLSLWSYPRVAVDFIGRPIAEQRWLDAKLSRYHLISAVTVYSRYPDELDDIISDIDRTLFRERISISGFRIFNPGNITPITPYREKLFVRSIRHDAVKQIVAP